MLYRLTRALCWAAGHTPRRPRLAVAGVLCEVVYWLWAEKRRVTIRNMAQVLGLPPNHPRVRWTARRSWRNYGRYVADFFYLPNATVPAIAARLRDVAPPPGWAGQMDRGRAAGSGALLVPTAHFGNWDVAGVMVGSHLPLHVIAETFPDPRLNDLVQRQRSALGMTVIPMERTPRRILRVLQEGGAVATPVDRPLAAGEGVPVVFFGRRCYVPGGIAQLALKTGAAIVPGFVYYDDDYSPAYYGYAAEPILPVASSNREADVTALTQRIYDVIEEHVRAHPTQWYMFRPFWPDGEPATDPANHTESAIPRDTSPLAPSESLSSGSLSSESLSSESASSESAQADFAAARLLGAGSPAGRTAAPADRAGASDLPTHLKYACFRAAAWLAPRVPGGLARGAGRLAGLIMWALAPGARRRADASLRHIPALACDDRRRAWAVRQVFRHLVLNYLDLFRVPHLTPAAIARDAAVVGHEHVDAALARGRGVVLLAAHLGNFEYAAAYVGDAGVPVTLLVERLRPERLYTFVRDLRSHHGVRAVPADSTETLRELYTALRRGEVVLITGDRDVLGSGQETPLFGVPARLPVGPALLAQRSGAALIGAFSWRESGARWGGCFFPIVIDAPETGPAGGGATGGASAGGSATAVRVRDRAAVARLLAPVARVLEQRIAAHPEQWVAALAPVWSAASSGKEGDEH